MALVIIRQISISVNQPDTHASAWTPTLKSRYVNQYIKNELRARGFQSIRPEPPKTRRKFPVCPPTWRRNRPARRGGTGVLGALLRGCLRCRISRNRPAAARLGRGRCGALIGVNYRGSETTLLVALADLQFDLIAQYSWPQCAGDFSTSSPPARLPNLYNSERLSTTAPDAYQFARRPFPSFSR